jgi:CBS domain-containing protein
LRLAHQLRQRAAGLAPGNELVPARLAADERQALRVALAVVKRWRGFLRQHFRLDTL